MARHECAMHTDDWTGDIQLCQCGKLIDTASRRDGRTGLNRARVAQGRRPLAPGESIFAQ